MIFPKDKTLATGLKIILLKILLIYFKKQTQ